MKISLINGQSGNEIRVDWNLKETQREFCRTESGSEFPEFAVGSVHKDIQQPKSSVQLMGVWEVYRRVVVSGQGFSVLLRRIQPSGMVSR